MRKAIAVFLVLVLLLTLGCGAKQQAGMPTVPLQERIGAPTAPPAGEATSAAVTDLDKELSEIDSIDSELSSEELDSLDSELNFEI